VRSGSILEITLSVDAGGIRYKTDDLRDKSQIK